MKIGLLGDLITDVYKIGHATRICPEAPCPVVVVDKEYATSGGCGLVKSQLQALGADVYMIPGSHSYKTRIFAGNHLICRIDADAQSGVPPEPEYMPKMLACDAFVISDYGKGAMTRELAEQIVATGKPCFVDAKKHWMWYGAENVWMFPNEHEERDAWVYGVPKQTVVKLSSQGCRMGNLTIPAVVNEVVDTTGAGDIFMASFVYAWSLQLPAEDCLRFANELAGESCRHLGTFVVGREFAQSVLDKLRASKASIAQDESFGHGSMTIEQARAAAKALQGVDLTPRNWDDFHAEGYGSLLGDWPLDAAKLVALQSNPESAQTLPQSPSDPNGSSGILPHADQKILDRYNSQQSAGSTPSSTESSNQCEHKSGQDRVLHPGKS